MTTTATPFIPTEPGQFDQTKVKAELARIEALLPKLEAYDDREFRELPKPLQDDIRAIRTIVQPTVGGLEKVAGILWQLWNSEEVCNRLLRGESIKSYVETVMSPENSSGTNPVEMPTTSAPTTSPQPVPAAATLQVDATQPSATQVAVAPNTSTSTLSIPSDANDTSSSAGTIVVPR